MRHSESDQRRYLRFPPPEWEVALIQLSDAPLAESDFEPALAGLVVEESQSGCGLVVLRRQIDARLAAGERCQVKVARLGLRLAEVRWISPIDETVARLGLHYVD